MTLGTLNASATPRRTPRASRWIWAVFGLFVTFYALLAFQSGIHNLPAFQSAERTEMLRQIELKGNEGVPLSEVVDDALHAYPLWNTLTAYFTGTRFGFGTNGNTEQPIYYASMSSTEQRVLSVHMILGSLCIVLGCFQFWPAFRKAYPRAHRSIGGIYILGSLTMVGASIFHLSHTSIAETYQGFAFHIQLWFLAISTLIAQVLAIVFLKKRNIALHMGFQVYTFLSFLNAPIQRYDWVVFGSIYPHLTQGEVNNLVNILTFWQCLLIGSLIFVWNRAAAPRRSTPAVVAPSPLPFKVMIATFTAIGVASVTATHLLWPGLGQWTVARGITNPTTLAADAALFDGKLLQNLIFALSIVAAMVSGVWLMIRDATSRRARRVFYVTGIIAGLIQMYWGYSLGEPSMAVTAGGGFYVVSGVSLFGFAVLSLYLDRMGNEGLWYDSMVFAVNFAFSPALLIWGFALWYALGVIPQHYIDIGHGYILSAGGAILTPAFNGFINLLGSRETAAHNLR